MSSSSSTNLTDFPTDDDGSYDKDQRYESYQRQQWKMLSSSASDLDLPSEKRPTASQENSYTSTASADITKNQEHSSVSVGLNALDSPLDSTGDLQGAVRSVKNAALESISSHVTDAKPQILPQSDDNGDDLRISIDDAIEKLGMGIFQWLILVAAGLCFAADAMEVLLLSFLAVVFQAQWSLTDEETASITSAVFLGASTGTLISGYLGDHFGRKPVFSMTAAIICVFGFATAFTNNLWSLIFCRFMVGFGVGGVTVPFDTLAEFVPTSHRGRDLLMIEYFWTGGTLLVPVVALFTLGRSDNDVEHDNEWRWFVIILGIPCLVSSIASIIYVPESPRWLLTQGKHDKALAILRAAAKKNGENEMEVFPPGTVLVQDQETEVTRLCDLFRPEWRLTTVFLWLCWGGFAVTYYGTIIAVTMIFASDDLEQEGVYSFDYTAILASASAEIAGTTIAILAVDRVGRIPTQVVSYVGGGICLFVLTFMAMDSKTPRFELILMGFFARLFFMGGSCTTWVSTAEIMPTEIRATGHSWANAFARLAGAASPFLVTENRPYVISGVIIMVISLATALISSRLPETKGHSMGMHATDIANSGVEVVRNARSYKNIV